jgi:hypothetical protein
MPLHYRSSFRRNLLAIDVWSRTISVNALAAFVQRFSRLRAAEAGSSIVELAVAVPILLLLAIGVAEYGRLYFTQITVANAARSGAEYGIKTDGNVDSMTYGAKIEAGKDSLGMVITAGTFCSCPDGSAADCITGDCGSYGVPRAFDSVAVKKVVRFFFHYPGFPDSMVIQRKSILRGA